MSSSSECKQAYLILKWTNVVLRKGSSSEEFMKSDDMMKMVWRIIWLNKWRISVLMKKSDFRFKCIPFWFVWFVYQATQSWRNFATKKLLNF